jgi:hypothetical protein
MFEFYINGQPIVNQPEGWNEITSAVKRDQLTGILLYDADISLKFYGGSDGYNALKLAWDLDPVGESTIDIKQRFPDGHMGLIHSGTIFHSSIRFELINNWLSFKSEDRGFYAMVNNNKKIETALNGSKTKNEVGIAPCPSFTLNVHKVSNGTLHFQCTAYKMIDVIRYLITFMTDNRMTVSAKCFDTGGIYEGICIVIGNELINHNGAKAPILSWEDLSNDLVKRLNVQFSITGSIDQPVMTIDTAADFYGQNNAYVIPTVPESVDLYTDEQKLYSCVEVGSDKTDTGSMLVFPDVYSLISFRTESFHFKGTNNIDRKLDLVGKYIVSHAVIEVTTEQISGYDAYTDDVFMIQYDIATSYTHKSNWVGGAIITKHLFNEMFTNQNVLNRWSGYFPNDISNTVFNPDANRFEAHCNDDVQAGGLLNYTLAGMSRPGYVSDADSQGGNILVNDIPFWNDFQFDSNYPNRTPEDPSNNYGGGIPSPQGSPVVFPNLYFSAPVNGFYNFYAEVFAWITYYTTNSTPKWRDKKVGIRFIKRDSSQNEIQHFDGPYFNVQDRWAGGNSQQFFTVYHNIGTFMNAGEIMECNLYHYVLDQYNNGGNSSGGDYYKVVAKQGYWGCGGISTGGGQLMPSNSDDYKSLKLEFSYPIDLAEYQQIINSKQGLIRVPLDQNRYVNGWVDNVKFEHNSGETKFTLLTNGATIYR